MIKDMHVYGMRKKEKQSEEEIKKAEELLRGWYDSLPLMKQFVERSKEENNEDN